MTQKIWIDNARIISCFAVVFLHVAGNIVYNGPGYGPVAWWAGNFYNAFSRWSVPFFLMITGTLLLAPEKSDSVSFFYRKRFRRILVPLIFWTMVYSLIRLWPHFCDRGALVSESIKLLRDVLSGNVYYHLWYVYMLVGLYLFLPVVRFVVRAAPPNELTLLCGVWFLIAILTIATYSFSGPAKYSLFLGGFFSFMPYCIAGYLVSVGRNKTKWQYLLLGAGAMGILTLLGSYALRWVDHPVKYYFYNFLSITVVPMSILLFIAASRFSRPVLGARFTGRISALTFGIYLVHPAIMKLLDAAGIKVTIITPLLGIPLVACLAFFISCGITAVITFVPYARRTI
ncbi:MAG: acyltransferase family protein [Chitinispirillaceae bacterium]|jgi:surface polysaccharide O-acyltransferase-like enzyme